MSINSLTNLINQTIPYAWDNSLSMMEFLGKIVSSMNEVIALVNEKLPDDFEVQFYSAFREYTTEEMDRIVANGQFQVILTSILEGVSATSAEVIEARDGNISLKAKFTAIKEDQAISPESYTGNAVQKISTAIQEAITNNKSVKFAKLYDITGLGPITINKPAINRTPLSFIGAGGGIKKTDVGYMFTTSLPDQGDIISSKMKYVSVHGAGTCVWNGNKMIRINSDHDSFMSCDQIIEGDQRYLQSIRIKNSTIIEGTGYAISARNTFDCTFSDNLVELRNSFMKNSYLITSPFQFDNMNLRITNNCIEGLTGKALLLGSCYGTKISGNYLELNNEGYIDLTANTNVVSHIGLEVSNNMIDLTAQQVIDDVPAIKWGFFVGDLISIGNTCNGLIHSIPVSGNDGKVISTGDYSMTAELTDNEDRFFTVNNFNNVTNTQGSIRKFGPFEMVNSNLIDTVSIAAGALLVVNIPLPKAAPLPAMVSFNTLPQWVANTGEIVSYEWGAGFTSINVKIKNNHSAASTFQVQAVVSYFV